jgi:hypothetical protein
MASLDVTAGLGLDAASIAVPNPDFVDIAIPNPAFGLDAAGVPVVVPDPSSLHPRRPLSSSTGGPDAL